MVLPTFRQVERSSLSSHILACAAICVFSTSILVAQTQSGALVAQTQSGALVAQTQPAAPTEPLTLQAAFDRALTANPTIAAARLRRVVDMAGISVAGERPNPDAHVEFDKETPKQAFGVGVPIELGGKRGKRIAVAEATLQVGEAELTQTIIDIRTQVRRAYFARLISDLRLAVLDELRQFATRARDAAQARFDVGSAPRLEVAAGSAGARSGRERSDGRAGDRECGDDSAECAARPPAGYAADAGHRRSTRRRP